MKLKTFVNIFGEIAVGLQHAMVEAAHKRFLSFFEDPDKDGTYEAKKHLLKLADELNLSFADLSGRLLDSMIGDTAEFEVDTPIEFTDTADTIDDVEVQLKSPGFLKSSSHVKIKIKFKHAPAPEGWLKLQDELDTQLQQSIKQPRKAK